jgi:PAS domain S-box-containing protein
VARESSPEDTRDVECAAPTSRRDSELRLRGDVATHAPGSWTAWDHANPKTRAHGAKACAAEANVKELRAYQRELEAQNTELRRMKLELELSRKRYFDLYHLAPVGYFTIDEQGCILQSNLRATEMLGHAGSSLERRALLDFIVSEDRHLFMRQLRLAFGANKLEPVEIRMQQKQGNAITVWMELRVGTSTDSLHRAEGRVTVTDFSLRKQLEKDREILQAQLFHAQKLESVGTLAGAVAHDFNNLLAGIMADLALLEFESPDPVSRGECLEDIKLLTQRGAELTRQLLGFARRGKLELTALDLAEVVEQTCKMFARTHKHISVSVRSQPARTRVVANRGQVDQVLLNLLMNAAQAMQNGGELSVAVEEVTLRSGDVMANGAVPGGYTKLSIVDTGIGMTEAVQRRMFEPFFTTRISGTGSGLGLASVQAIVKNHKGFLQVDSSPGKGTTVCVYLPNTTRKPSTLPSVAAVARHSGMETILLVDDEEHITRSWGRTLRHLGYHVLVAHSGPQALEVLECNGPTIALVILDLIMPGMGGKATFDQIRRLDPEMKVLFWSGSGRENVAQELLNAGCSGFIQKPVSVAELSLKLRELMTGAQQTH